MGLWWFPSIRVCSGHIGIKSTVSQLFHTYIFRTYSCLFLFIPERVPGISFSILDTFGSCVIPVCLCLSVLHSYWFVLIRVNLYHVRGAFPLLLTTNISRTSRIGSNHYKNAVRTCWMNYEFSTNSKRYTNEYECFKQPDTFVSTLRTTKILWTM